MSYTHKKENRPDALKRFLIRAPKDTQETVQSIQLFLNELISISAMNKGFLNEFLRSYQGDSLESSEFKTKQPAVCCDNAYYSQDSNSNHVNFGIFLVNNKMFGGSDHNGHSDNGGYFSGYLLEITIQFDREQKTTLLDNRRWPVDIEDGNWKSAIIKTFTEQMIKIVGQDKFDQAQIAKAWYEIEQQAQPASKAESAPTL